MRWKEFVGDYFTFSYRDRIAVLSLLFLIIFLLFLPSFIHNLKRQEKPELDTAIMAKLQQFKPATLEKSPSRNIEGSYYQFNTKKSKTPGLFFFDPNKLPYEEWQRLGLRERTISTIRHYLERGGRFRKPEDLQKIYGLFPDEYTRLAPYIRIETHSANGFTKDTASLKYPKEQIPSTTYHVDVNTSDTSDWIALPGIGSKLATRILNFREKLGGFYSIDQVKETYGLPDTTFQKIRIFLFLQPAPVKTISLNNATVEELKAHPYIRWALANPIIAYRKEHGPFHNLEELKNIMAITDEVFERIKHYLVVE